MSFWDDHEEAYLYDYERIFRKPIVQYRDCALCGKKNLYWKEIRTAPGNRKAWRLHDVDGPHVCPPIDPSTEFEPLE